MRTLVSIITLLLLMSTISYASTRSDVMILEASEEIKQSAQEMAKDYMLLYIDTSRKKYYDRVVHKIEAIEKSIRTIAFATNNPKIKRILDFFAYEKEQLKSRINKNPDTENAMMILDSSDVITEGAEKIAELTQYSATMEEKMFMSCKRIIYLIEKISKYYIVMGSDMEKSSVMKKMNRSIAKLDHELAKIKQYEYVNHSTHFSTEKKELFALWRFAKNYYAKVKTVQVPSVLLVSGSGMEKIINDISIYHSKN